MIALIFAAVFALNFDVVSPPKAQAIAANVIDRDPSACYCLECRCDVCQCGNTRRDADGRIDDLGDGSPAVASGFRWQCSGNSCRLVPDNPSPPRPAALPSFPDAAGRPLQRRIEYRDAAPRFRLFRGKSRACSTCG